MLRLSKAATLGFLTGILGLVISLTPFGFDLDKRFGLDILFKLRGARQAPTDVLIVSIDKASTTRLNLPNNPEKWPRSLHARLAKNLANAGAAVIVFDLIFDESRSAVDDQAFAEAIRQTGNVVLFEYLRRESVAVRGKSGSHKGVLHIESLVPPIPPLAEAAGSTFTKADCHVCLPVEGGPEWTR